MSSKDTTSTQSTTLHGIGSLAFGFLRITVRACYIPIVIVRLKLAFTCSIELLSIVDFVLSFEKMLTVRRVRQHAEFWKMKLITNAEARPIQLDSPLLL